MPKAIITLATRVVIGPEAAGQLEKDIFNDSYQELLMQSQTYNPGGAYTTLAQMTAANPKANSLHYKVAFAVTLYIQQLKAVLPGVTDTLGRPQALFENHQFEILQSDITTKAAHRVAITFQTAPLTLLDSFGDYLLIDKPPAHETIPPETYTVQLKEGICMNTYAAR